MAKIGSDIFKEEGFEERLLEVSDGNLSMG